MRPKPISVRKLAAELGLDEQDLILEVRHLRDRKGVDKRVGRITSPHDVIPGPVAKKLRTGARQETRSVLTQPQQRPTSATVPAVKAPRPKGADDSETDTAPPSFGHVGKVQSLKYLTEDEVLFCHNTIAADARASGDPIDPPGARDSHLLASALYRPHTGIGDNLKYPTAPTAAAALLCAIVNNHPFHNGNKRTALVAMLVFFDENGLTVTCSEDDLFELVLKIARHRITDVSGPYGSDLEMLEVAKIINGWTRSTTSAAPTLSFRQFESIMRDYGCGVAIKSGRAVITRERRRGNRWTRPFRNRASFTYTMGYRNPGTDVAKHIVREARNELQLDTDNGVDDADFFAKKPLRVDDFVNRYRRTLGLLAKL